MLRLFFAFFFVCQLSFAFAQHYNEKYGQPVVVLIETNPWLMVIGSDVPSFALYENGQIIYRKVVDRTYRYYEVKKSREETQALIKSFGITDSLMHQKDYTQASSWTDQPTNVLLLNFDTVRQISVYGNLRSEKSEARQKTPKDFLSVYDNIIKFEDAAAQEWLPDTVEVMATRYGYSPEVPLKWPKKWGDMNSSTTVKRGQDLYSLYLDKRYFADFRKLLAKLKEKQAVEISGEKYSLTYRLPFPNLR